MLASIVRMVVDGGLSYLTTRADTETERQKIAAQREAAANTTAAGVVTAGMQHKAFWIPWLLAAVPLSAWFAWGVADSIANGALPDVATLPPQLKQYADTVWQNIFYTGAAMGGAQLVAQAIRGRR